jgi:hypothetical protein
MAHLYGFSNEQSRLRVWADRESGSATFVIEIEDRETRAVAAARLTKMELAEWIGNIILTAKAEGIEFPS